MKGIEVKNDTGKRRVLLTGAAGRIGAALVAQERERYAFRLAYHSPESLAENDGGGHEQIVLDVADLDAVREACAGIDTVVHLAADPSPSADFYGSLLDSNIKGAFNVFQAAQDQGCARVVFASSVHAVAGYPVDVQPRTTDQVRPMNMYGATKCFGEATAACFAYQGLSCICIRIGAYEAPWIKEHGTALDLGMYVSPRDLNQLIVLCIETPDIPFAIVNGLSDNTFKRMDLSSTRELLGYEPVDNGFTIYEKDVSQRTMYARKPSHLTRSRR
jgi:nucleoside-diphosphate-sugar epimerase